MDNTSIFSSVDIATRFDTFIRGAQPLVTKGYETVIWFSCVLSLLLPIFVHLWKFIYELFARMSLPSAHLQNHLGLNVVSL